MYGNLITSNVLCSHYYHSKYVLYFNPRLVQADRVTEVKGYTYSMVSNLNSATSVI